MTIYIELNYSLKKEAKSLNFLGSVADCEKIASNDNKFVLRATYFTKNPGAAQHPIYSSFSTKIGQL